MEGRDWETYGRYMGYMGRMDQTWIKWVEFSCWICMLRVDGGRGSVHVGLGAVWHCTDIARYYLLLLVLLVLMYYTTTCCYSTKVHTTVLYITAIPDSTAHGTITTTLRLQLLLLLLFDTISSSSSSSSSRFYHIIPSIPVVHLSLSGSQAPTTDHRQPVPASPHLFPTTRPRTLAFPPPLPPRSLSSSLPQ